MGKDQAKKITIVLSPGRSGTSLIMQILRDLGMELSPNLIPGSVSNPEGLFEDAEIVQIHKELIQALNTNPVLPLPNGWLDYDVTKQYRSRLRKLLHHRLKGIQTIWGFKDPRTATFLPLWHRILGAPGIVPCFLLAVRDPAAVSISLKRQIGRNESVTELQWLQRTIDAITHTATNCYIIHYEDWFKHPKQLTQGILTYTGLDQYFEGDVERVIKGAIKSNLNRSIYDEYTVKNNLVAKLYDALKNCRGDDFDRKNLMQVVNECRTGMLEFKGWFLEAHKHIGQENKLKDRIQVKTEALKKKIDLTDRLKTENQQIIERSEKMKQHLKSDNSTKLEKDPVIQKIEADLISKNQQIKAIKAELDQMTTVSKDREAMIREMTEEREQTANQIEELIEELRAAAEKHQNAHLPEDDDTRHDCEAVDATVAVLEAEMEQQVLENNHLLTELKDLTEEVQELKIQLSSTHTRKTETPRPLKEKPKALSKVKQKKPTINPKLMTTEVERLRNEIFTLQNSTSYRLGNLLVFAIRRPGKNTLLLPLRLIKLGYQVLFKKNAA